AGLVDGVRQQARGRLGAGRARRPLHRRPVVRGHLGERRPAAAVRPDGRVDDPGRRRLRHRGDLRHRRHAVGVHRGRRRPHGGPLEGALERLPRPGRHVPAGRRLPPDRERFLLGGVLRGPDPRGRAGEVSMAGKITDRSLGVFDTRALVGAFDPKISEFKLSEPRFGANLQAMYLYGGMHSDSGKFYVVERKFLSSMTGGLFIMSNQGGSMELDPGSPRSGRGEVRREFDDTSMRWHEPIMQRIPEELRVAEEQPLDLRVTDDEFRWSEGNLLDLSGPMPSVGLQFVAPMKGQLLVYQSQCYWLKGTLLGEEAEGPIFFDHIFWTPHGLEWKETPMYTDRQVSWTIFGNKLDDGA